MNTRRSRPAGRMRPGLTLPELLAAIVVLGVLGTLLLSRRSPVPLTCPSLAAPDRYTPISSEQTRGNLLVNGSFEQCSRRRGRAVSSFGLRSMPGWRISRGTVDVLSPDYWQPAPRQGRLSLDLVGTPGAATIEQTFATAPGRIYRFSGWVAHNPEKWGAVDARALVFLNGRRFIELYHRDPRAHNRAMGWKPFAYRFRAGAKRTTLSIADVSGHGDRWGTALDGLAVIRVAD
jgi:prepilin-type N-terminal cleavage/methylation domain-containing protein